MRNVRKYIALAVAVFFVAALPAVAQMSAQSPESAKVLLRFAKEGIDCGCSQTVGIVEQSLMRLDGVKNARVDAKNYGVNVSYDPNKTTPEKILASFNKLNPEFALAVPQTGAMTSAGRANFESQEKQSEPASTNLQITQCALKVSGMTCGGCAEAVKQRLLKLEGVKTATVDYKTGDVQVEFDAKKTTPEKIVNAFNDGSGGFKAKIADEKKENTEGPTAKEAGKGERCCP